MVKYGIPLGIFIVLVIFLGIGLKLDPTRVPSPLIDKAAPAFTLPRLHVPDATFSPAEMQGQVWLLNVWASWCPSCRIEHPVFNALAKSGEVPIIGLNYKDKREDARRWLRQLGDPFTAIAVDADGRVGIDWGVYGVPETFLIDKSGRIRHKHIGPVTDKVLRETILPQVRQLNGDTA